MVKVPKGLLPATSRHRLHVHRLVVIIQATKALVSGYREYKDYRFMTEGTLEKRYSGGIENWNDTKGYGFVPHENKGSRVFVHVKSFEELPKRPSDGDLISYTLRRDHLGRLSAAGIRFESVSKSSARSPLKLSVRKTVAAIFIALLLMGFLTGKVSGILLLAYCLMSLLTFLVYGIDKFRAIKHLWRTQEITLHLMSLAGGWPGALLAQDLFRHKSRKTSFQVIFWGTVVLNTTGLLWLLLTGVAEGFSLATLQFLGAGQ